MENFQGVLLRLKEQLGVETDKEVAELLGMSVKAFTARKARGAFPEDKLLALVALRPDLLIDPSYVLTGDYLSVAQAKLAASHYSAARDTARLSNVALTQHLTADEQELLALFRAAPLSRKAEAVRVLAGDNPTQPKPKKGKGISVVGDGNRTAGENYHEKE
ncbi:MAG TPA: helix-turn-helix domain-containing protein [Pseudomonas sp.]|uniref:helix-turn-helix domain-containing protein n=1 Tax=Pseudomonas sp. TaxID=306 RepID=UPI002BDEACC0|nr:helix-turn-helix domain-containing protein [Pseudomonas sp.]HRL94725.1 helix-turn-helix domain-containing protein [Pseudomonas sp.]